MRQHTRINHNNMLPIGWPYLSDALVVRAAVESQALGDPDPLAQLTAEGRVIEVPDGAEVEVVMVLSRMALVRLADGNGGSIEAWIARAAIEPQDAPGEAEEEGRPHRAIVSRPRPRRD